MTTRGSAQHVISNASHKPDLEEPGAHLLTSLEREFLSTVGNSEGRYGLIATITGVGLLILVAILEASATITMFQGRNITNLGIVIDALLVAGAALVVLGLSAVLDSNQSKAEARVALKLGVSCEIQAVATYKASSKTSNIYEFGDRDLFLSSKLKPRKGSTLTLKVLPGSPIEVERGRGWIVYFNGVSVSPPEQFGWGPVRNYPSGFRNPAPYSD